MPLERPFSGERLRAFRDWLSLTRPDVAGILGLGETTIEKYEKFGAPEWVRLALLGWAVVVHGSSRRATARHLGLPWEHFPLEGGTPPDEAALAQFAALDAPPPSDGTAAAGPTALSVGDEEAELGDDADDDVLLDEEHAPEGHAVGGRSRG